MTVPSATIFSASPAIFRALASTTNGVGESDRSTSRTRGAAPSRNRRSARIERRFGLQFVADLQILEDAADAVERLLIRHDRDNPLAIGPGRGGRRDCGGLGCHGCAAAPPAPEPLVPLPGAAEVGFAGAAIGPIFAAAGSWTLPIR